MTFWEITLLIIVYAVSTQVFALYAQYRRAKYHPDKSLEDYVAAMSIVQQSMYDRYKHSDGGLFLFSMYWKQCWVSWKFSVTWLEKIALVYGIPLGLAQIILLAPFFSVWGLWLRFKESRYKYEEPEA